MSNRADYRVLSVRRPWANLIVAGHKDVENRSWTTRYRGLLVVHAGATWESAGAACAEMAGITGFGHSTDCSGGYLGYARLVDVHPSGACCAPWGHPDPGGYHWVLADPVPFPCALPGPGRLNLYPVPAHVLDILP